MKSAFEIYEPNMQNVIEILQRRNFIDDMTSDELVDFMQKPRFVYCGFDPTSDSLHLGNLVSIMGLAWMQRLGHTPVAIVGGATGMIGDPSGKDHERQLLDEQTIEINLKGITKNLEAVLDFDVPNKPLILNNLDWFKEFSYIGFLREVGKLFRVGPMLAKEAVKTRLNSEEGMSYTEFSYQLLQGYDFLHLNRDYGVTVQMGGSDQWGNITAGTELVRKVGGSAVYGITFPLITRSDGKKFGKSEKGAIWLSPDKLSDYEFYQHLIRVSDADVTMLMRMITFMEMEEIEGFERALQQGALEPNTAQKRLAEEVTRLVRGEEGLKTALRTTAAAAPGAMTELNCAQLESIAQHMPSFSVAYDRLVGAAIVELAVESGLQPSKGAARRLIQNGGFYLNNEKVCDVNLKVAKEDLIEDKMLLLSVGTKNKMLIRVAKG